MVELLINIDVDDLDVASRFYTQALGLTVGRRLEGGTVELLGGSARVYLIENAAGTRAVPGTELARHYTRHWTPVHLDVAVPDLDVALRRATAAGARLEQPVTDYVWGRQAVLSDPFGHGWCLLELSEAGYDAIAVDD
jgi:uncharacterized glyoxalase superfamily protein PhnB